MASESTRQWLRQNTKAYANPSLLFNQVDRILGSYSTLRPKTAVYTFNDGRTQLLLCLHGLLPINFRGKSYNIPVALWIKHDFPNSSPMAYVVPSADMVVRQSHFVDLSGEVRVPYADNWQRKSEGCSLEGLIQALSDLFSQEPPLYAKPPQSQSQSTSQPSQGPPIRPPKPTGMSPPPPPTSSTSPAPTGYSVRPPPPLPNQSQSPPPPFFSQVTPAPHHPPSHIQSPAPPPPSQVQSPQPPPAPPRPQSLYYPYPNQSISPSPHPQVPQPEPRPNRWSLNSPAQAQIQSVYPSLPAPTLGPGPVYPQAPTSGGPDGTRALIADAVASPPPPPPGLGVRHTTSGRDQSVIAHVSPYPQPQNPRPPPPQNLLDGELELPEVRSGSNGAHPPFQRQQSFEPPPKPVNPELAALHGSLHAKLTQSLASLLVRHNDHTAQQLKNQSDLLQGGPAIRDEMARLGAVRDVCLSVVGRMGDVVRRAEGRVGALRVKGDPEVDELICSSEVVWNQLIDLVAEDNAIEDTIYHLHRAHNAGRIDLERFLRTTRALAEEQFMKRALVEKILAGSQGGNGQAR